MSGPAPDQHDQRDRRYCLITPSPASARPPASLARPSAQRRPGAGGVRCRDVDDVGRLWGYTRSALQCLPRYGDREFRRFLRQYQYACLLHGKTTATARLNARQESVWRRSHDATGRAIGRQS